MSLFKFLNANNSPLIAVTGPARRFPIGWWAARFILRLAGARACYITPARPILPNNVQGVVIGGGDDIEPKHYGEEGDAGSLYDPERDKLEIAVIRAALDHSIPMIGICRGAQLINVVLGGSLYQDIRPLRSKTPNRNSAFPIKWAHIEKHTSRMRQLMQRDVIHINSLHNQAMQRIADDLLVTARDSDGFVQAVECRHRTYLVGVQWHPEYLPYHTRQRRLFTDYVTVVKNEQKHLSPSALQ